MCDWRAYFLHHQVYSLKRIFKGLEAGMSLNKRTYRKPKNQAQDNCSRHILTHHICAGQQLYASLMGTIF